MVLCMVLAICGGVCAAEYHVAVSGDDKNPGTDKKPLLSIQRGAELAQPGDTVTVHEGTYRERVNPPRGGESDAKRIVYQAAPGEKVVIKGSEVVKGWEKVQGDVWKVTLPNSFFGAFNPYKDYIRGDWFLDTDWTGRTTWNGGKNARRHHTGTVYLNGAWMLEAATLDEVLGVKEIEKMKEPAKAVHLFNVLWFKTKGVDAQIGATKMRSSERVKPAEVLAGQCLGYVEDGGFAVYDKVDFGAGSDEMEFSAASPNTGGLIEVRLDGPEGELLGTSRVFQTMGQENWNVFRARIKPVKGVHTIYLGFKKHTNPEALDDSFWYAKVDDQTTTIWAQFKGANPNEQQVEINVRQTVFYPDKPGRNYITVRGFTMRDAATPWAPPTAEQIGLLGVHWSKGWIIENNTISHSINVGITLGKYGDEFDNATSKMLAAKIDPSFVPGVDPSFYDGALAYNRTVERAIKSGWSKETIGSHIVRNNKISFCEQAGVVGSLGAIYSTITGNEIHHIHIRNRYYGDEIAAIKIHAPIDVEISGNHIYRTDRGMWLDWMTQGTRISRNLLHGNRNDWVGEINHGPCLVDNNLLLSGDSIDASSSRGSAYVHNLTTGAISGKGHDKRQTPFYKPHSTTFGGLHEGLGGDDRFYNNIFVGGGADLARFDNTQLPNWFGGNVFLKGAIPSSLEVAPVVEKEFNPDIQLIEREDGWYLTMKVDKSWAQQKKRQMVTTALLGKALVPDMAFEQPDGTPISVDTDYFGKKRAKANPIPGPFADLEDGEITLKVW